MSNPFKKALAEVIRGYEDAQPDSLPSWTCLRFLKGFLAHQESKLLATDQGLLDCLFQLFDSYRKLISTGTAWNEVAEAKVAGLPAPKSGIPGTPDLTCMARQEVVSLVCSLVTLGPAREILFGTIGMDRVLELLADPHPLVRVGVCQLLALCAKFPDGQDLIRDMPALAEAVQSIACNDSDARVVAAAVATAAELAIVTPVAGDGVPGWLVGYLSELTAYIPLSEVPTSSLSTAISSSSSNSSGAGDSGSGDASRGASAAAAPAGPARHGDVDSKSASTSFRSTPSSSSSSSAEAAAGTGSGTSSNGSTQLPASAIPAAPLPGNLEGVAITTALASALEALHRMSETPKNKHTIIAAGAVSTVGPLLRCASYAVRCGAAKLLMAVASEDSARRQVAADGNSLACLGAIATETRGPAPLRATAIKALHSTAEASTGLHRVGVLLVTSPQTIRQVLTPEMEARVIDRLLEPGTLRLPALRSLDVLCSTKQGALAAWGIENLVPRLEGLAAAQHSPLALSGDAAASGQERLLASKILAVLCHEVREARTDLDKLREGVKAGPESAAKEGYILQPGVKPAGVWPA